MLRYGCLLLLSARIRKFGCDIIMLYIYHDNDKNYEYIYHS